MENEKPKCLNSCDMDKEKIFALFLKKSKTGEFSSISHLRKQIRWIEINSTIVFWFCSKERKERKED